MSDRDGYQDDAGTDMTRRMRDQENERMLEGGTDSSFDALADALRTPDDIDPTVADAHIAAAASLAREAPAPAVDHASAAALPWYRRAVVRGAGLGLTAKLLLGGAVAVAATGGAAAGGILPAPIQGAIAEAVSHIGIDLPNPRFATITTTTTVVTTARPAGTSTTSSPPPEDDDDGGVIVAGATPGVYAWNGIACDGVGLFIRYRVTTGGELELVSTVGHTDEIDEDDDRIRVDFDGVEVDIRIDGGTVTIEEDRDCDAGSGTGSSTTTTQPDDDDDDDSDDASDDRDDAGDGGPAPGAYNWSSASCAGGSISVSYTVTEAGTLVLGRITGQADDIDEDDDRIRVDFDGVQVELRIDGDTVTIDEDRDCDDN